MEMEHAPSTGELWLDEIGWATTRSPVLVLIDEVTPDGVRGHTIAGRRRRVEAPLETVAKTWSWQGYWSDTYKTLPRLEYPFAGHELSGIPKSSAATKLHPTAVLVNAITPSLAPYDAQGFLRDFTGVRVNMDRVVSSVHSDAKFLQLFIGTPRLAGYGAFAQRGSRLRELWYQRQRNAWWLVRTLIVRSPFLLGDVGG